MDWINEKLERLKVRMANRPLKRALILYLLAALLAGFACTCVTNVLFERWISMVYRRNGSGSEQIYAVRGQYYLVFPRDEVTKLPESDENILAVLNAGIHLAPFLYVGIFIILASYWFYNTRLKTPFQVLKMGTEEIKENNLDFEIVYENEDEMGELCASFEGMRQELIANKEELWNLIEEQKKINAAFAHDLRTPLTVLKGYTDFLYRYIPEGKVSEEKLAGTLKLMSQHLERLSAYSRTMKNIRSFEEMEPQKTEITAARLKCRLAETAAALDEIGDIKIYFAENLPSETQNYSCVLWLDEIMVMEVFDNLLSNAIRFANSSVQISMEIESVKQLLTVYVKDDGAGFTKEELQMASFPYFHGVEQNIHKAEQREEHFGIGLHIAKQLCTKHGGALSLANSMEGGALVSVSFSYRKS